ncbi:hypothetical protein WOLCODRAFT_21806 [Wolfiporia cocos MD-104 SS10]|uniref:Uncharacterized protein n=1 Tax=Wolfiporia cocos (strain MD-104) TaxID=742152 RepID=A0A2H3IT54_WOLCO|nr:hypothetical protein WOLCODRAFT_21806 [Wolfiporia cocos MD-104 SS10]
MINRGIAAGVMVTCYRAWRVALEYKIQLADHSIQLSFNHISESCSRSNCKSIMSPRPSQHHDRLRL